MRKFNREKALKQIEFNRQKKKYFKYLSIGLPCIVAIITVFYFAYAKFSDAAETEVVNKTVVGDFIRGDEVIAYKIIKASK